MHGLDHLIYDGMAQSLTRPSDVLKGNQGVRGSVRPTTSEEPKMNKYVVNQVMQENYPYVAQSIGRDTMEEAIEVAVKLVMNDQRNNTGDSEERVRQELTKDGFYIPGKHAEWSVCINEVIQTPSPVFPS